ncbi:gamma-glutamyltransferase [Gammaproteobacteria bacterium]|nr:gamma-glutamyltransferase [Gammaproteobacteria bacterium]
MKNIFLFIIIEISASLVHASDIYRASPERYIGKSDIIEISIGTKYMAVTSDPQATEAAYNVLSNGGTAADAAIAAQFVLGLTEPQSSGLGGGAFVIYYNAKQNLLTTFDGRETAPLASTPNYFLKNDKNPLGFYEAVLDGRSVGVPGTPAILGKLHERFGKTDIQKLIKPAVTLAMNGFAPSRGLLESLQNDIGRLDKNKKSKEYFYNKNVIKNKNYADVLKAFANKGHNIFYKFPISTNIINAVNKKNGVLTQKDFDRYRVIERKPVCGIFQKHKVCSMGEPSSGALTMLQILKLIDHNPTWHNYIEASKLAFADRNYYIADPDFVKTPGELLLEEGYILKRRALISSNNIINNAKHGIPSDWQESNQAKYIGLNESGTTHISIIDKYGNVISMTSTIENAFGSRIMANGYLLNNELTDFSFIPQKNNNLVANRVEAGKRPRSSMTPTIVFSTLTDKPTLIIGSAGGSRIIGYVTQRIIDVLYNNMSLEDAINAPHIVNRGGNIEAEEETSITNNLSQKGHLLDITPLASGLTAIYIDSEKNIIKGVSDPRRIGIALGK